VTGYFIHAHDGRYIQFVVEKMERPRTERYNGSSRSDLATPWTLQIKTRILHCFADTGDTHDTPLAPFSDEKSKVADRLDPMLYTVNNFDQHFCDVGSRCSFAQMPRLRVTD
jgi:hypothetical protein